MNKKTKSSIILTSLGAIAIAGSLIAGSTYALFTSESKTNIAVTSGTVSVVASASELSAHSPTLINSDGTISDDTELASKVSDNEYKFGNDGSVKLESGNVLVDRMTPGDKISFNIDITNQSNVAVKYRYGYTVLENGDHDLSQAHKLVSALNFTMGDLETKKYAGYKCKWASLAPNTALDPIAVSIEFPTINYDEEGVDVSNDYQDLGATICFVVEAIQGNASTYGGEYIEVSDFEQLMYATEHCEDDSEIKLVSDI